MPPRTPTAAHPAGADEQLELGRRIRQIRTTEAKMTIEALASAAGVSISLISQIERGRAEPSLNSLRRIGAALGVPIARFFVGEDDPSDGESDAMGRRLVARCDGVLRIGGTSAGADEMVALARERGATVWFDIDDVPGV